MPLATYLSHRPPGYTPSRSRPAGGIVLQLHQIKARVARLDELTRALRKEILTIAAGDDPLLHLECRRHLAAMARGGRGVRRGP